MTTVSARGTIRTDSWFRAFYHSRIRKTHECTCWIAPRAEAPAPWNNRRRWMLIPKGRFGVQQRKTRRTSSILGLRVAMETSRWAALVMAALLILY